MTTRPVSSTRPTGLQSLTYSYDPVWNIVGIADDAQDVIYYDNTAVVRDQAFAYDALYRLKRATGREKGDRVQPWSGDPAFLDIPNTEALRNYIELYSYDEVGNITQMVHKADPSTVLWTRDYDYASDSNQLESTTEVPGTVHYVHDARGNIVYLPPMRYSSTHVANIEVTFRDQMRKVFLNDDDTAYYFYDSGGQRVRKAVKTGPVEDRRYVGAYEVWTRTVSGDLRQERTTLHVMDGQSRVAMIETKTITDGDADGNVVVRYQLGNHLGTSCIELDEDANVISYEEYHPYGSTAWWSSGGDSEVSQKRYRYTGMERDDETGLQCHGVRYYAVWLGRWTSADPIGLGDGVNRFAYCHGGPVGGRDPSGLADRPGECRADGDDPVEQTIPRTSKGSQLYDELASGSLSDDAPKLELPDLLDQGAQTLRARTASSGLEEGAIYWVSRSSGTEGIIYVGQGFEKENGQGTMGDRLKAGLSLVPEDADLIIEVHSHPSDPAQWKAMENAVPSDEDKAGLTYQSRDGARPPNVDAVMVTSADSGAASADALGRPGSVLIALTSGGAAQSFVAFNNHDNSLSSERYNPRSSDPMTSLRTLATEGLLMGLRVYVTPENSTTMFQVHARQSNREPLSSYFGGL